VRSKANIYRHIVLLETFGSWIYAKRNAWKSVRTRRGRVSKSGRVERLTATRHYETTAAAPAVVAAAVGIAAAAAAAAADVLAPARPPACLLPAGSLPLPLPLSLSLCLRDWSIGRLRAASSIGAATHRLDRPPTVVQRPRCPSQPSGTSVVVAAGRRHEPAAAVTARRGVVLHRHPAADIHRPRSLRPTAERQHEVCTRLHLSALRVLSYCAIRSNSNSNNKSPDRGAEYCDGRVCICISVRLVTLLNV